VKHILSIRQAPRRDSARRCLPGGLAVVTSYFNPCNYTAPKRNYRRFAAGLAERGVAFFPIELAFDDQPFFLSDNEAVLRLRGGDVMWQKERLLNLAIQHVPKTFDKIAWVDGDILFTNPDWMHDAAERLEEFPAVQLFEQATMLDAQGRTARTWPGVAWRATQQHSDALRFSRSHPGFAWAARRSLCERHGLLDDQILGGGDALMVLAMFGRWDHPHLARQPAALRASWLRWARPFWHDVRGRVGAVAGNIVHQWHGRTVNRRYVQRQSWLVDAVFDPRRDLTRTDGGAWRWATEKRSLHHHVERYFLDRREDENVTNTLV
jgi:hypothetical protein